MNLQPFWGQLAGVITVILMLGFLGIWAWLWLPQHKRKLDQMARLPMQDEDSEQ